MHYLVSIRIPKFQWHFNCPHGIFPLEEGRVGNKRGGTSEKSRKEEEEEEEE
jgi:hypothetical protein